MPAQRHTKKANTSKKQRQWEHVRYSELQAGKTPGEADMIANGVIKKETQKKPGAKRPTTKKASATIANTGPAPFKVTAKKQKARKKINAS